MDSVETTFISRVTPWVKIGDDWHLLFRTSFAAIKKRSTIDPFRGCAAGCDELCTVALHELEEESAGAIQLNVDLFKEHFAALSLDPATLDEAALLSAGVVHHSWRRKNKKTVHTFTFNVVLQFASLDDLCLLMDTMYDANFEKRLAAVKDKSRDPYDLLSKCKAAAENGESKYAPLHVLAKSETFDRSAAGEDNVDKYVECFGMMLYPAKYKGGKFVKVPVESQIKGKALAKIPIGNQVKHLLPKIGPLDPESLLHFLMRSEGEQMVGSEKSDSSSHVSDGDLSRVNRLTLKYQKVLGDGDQALMDACLATQNARLHPGDFKRNLDEQQPPFSLESEAQPAKQQTGKAAETTQDRKDQRPASKGRGPRKDNFGVPKKCRFFKQGKCPNDPCRFSHK